MKLKNSGFSLSELLTVIAVIGILVSVGLPNYQDTLRNDRLRTGANDFIAALHYGRSASTAKKDMVTMCIANSAGSGCLGGNEWKNGWIVFVDTNDDGIRDAGEEILRVHEALNDEIQMLGTGNALNSVRFRPSGLTNLTGTETLIMCDDRGYSELAKGIVVTITGRASVLAATETSKASC